MTTSKLKILKKWIIPLYVLILCSSMAGYGQSSVTGTVTASEDGLPLPGASVLIKGTTIGVVTDFDGEGVFCIYL